MALCTLWLLLFPGLALHSLLFRGTLVLGHQDDLSLHESLYHRRGGVFRNKRAAKQDLVAKGWDTWASIDRNTRSGPELLCT